MNYENASAQGEPRFPSDTEELKRVLITQFYEDSVLRYGPDSEQALALSKFPGPSDYDAEQKSVERALTNGRSHPAMQGSIRMDGGIASPIWAMSQRLRR
jgi:hypothetical protein